MTTSCSQNEPFPPWHVDGEPQLNDGQYFSKASFNVDTYTKDETIRFRKVEVEGMQPC